MKEILNVVSLPIEGGYSNFYGAPPVSITLWENYEPGYHWSVKGKRDSFGSFNTLNECIKDLLTYLHNELTMYEHQVKEYNVLREALRKATR